MHRVLMTDRAWPDFELERSILGAANAELIEAADQEEATLISLAGDVDVIATCWAQVTTPVILAGRRLRGIARFGIGLDNIALETATERGIPVTFVPDYCVGEVADHTLACVLALARNVALFHARSKAGEYDRLAGPTMRRLSELTLGLVGFGRIARAVFQRAKSFGMKVLASSPSRRDYGTGCSFVSLPELLRQSDIVSLHLPLTVKNDHLIGANELALMKRTAFLINTSRGPLIDQQALYHAIQQCQIAGAALDVFDPEPPDLSEPLFQNERVLVTPHAAFYSRESLVELRTRTAQQIVDLLENRRPEHVANPELFSRPT